MGTYYGKNCSIVLLLNHQNQKEDMASQCPMFDALCQSAECDDEEEFELENTAIQVMHIAQESEATKKVVLIKISMSDTEILDVHGIFSFIEQFRKETPDGTVLVYCSCPKAEACIGRVIAFDALLQEGTRSGSVDVPAFVKDLCSLSGRKMSKKDLCSLSGSKMFKNFEDYLWLNRILANAKSQESMKTEEDTRDAEGEQE